MEEFRHFINEGELMKKESIKQIQKLDAANERIERQELIISELDSYIKWMHKFLATQDKELGILNDGPATLGGPLTDALE